MKKYLFIVLLVGFLGCKDESRNYLDLEWFYWCGKSAAWDDCSHDGNNCISYTTNDIDTSGTIYGERGLWAGWFTDEMRAHQEYIRWFEDEKLLVYKNYGEEEQSKDIQAYIDSNNGSVCFWFNEK